MGARKPPARVMRGRDRVDGLARHPNRMISSFLTTFTITILGLLTTTLILRAKTSRISAAAQAIARNAAPSVDELSTIRTTLRHMEVALSGYVEQVVHEGRAVPPPESLGKDRRELRRDWQLYRDLPAFPGERAVVPDLAASLSELEQNVGQVLASGEGGDGRRAKELFDHRLKPSFDDVGGRLHEAMALNVAASSDAAAEIETIRQEAMHLSNTLYGAWLVFAGLAAVVAVRLARQYTLAMEHQIAELELFAGRLAHDVRGPLTSVAFAVAISQERTSDEKSKAFLGRAHRTLVRTGELMDGLLLLARLVRTKDQTDALAHVREVLADVLENFRPVAKENRVELDLGEIASCSVACSAGVLTNMVGNLLDNSIKHMGDSPVRAVVLSAVEAGDKVRIRVEDTGPGVPASAQGRIFDLYARAAPTDVCGLGLGLATVRRLAEVLGGAAGMKPGESCGSLFWIELPKTPHTTA